MLARVAIDLALDRLFDYEVPVSLQKKLAVGQLLSVPFGHRQARGFVLEMPRDGEMPRGGGIYQDRKGGFKLKEVTAIVDETPFFSPALLELVKKLAAYCAAPVESVLKAALPAAVLKKNVKPKELLYVEAGVRGEGIGVRGEELGVRGEELGVRSEGLGVGGEEKLTKRQQWLYEQIVRLGGGWMTQLCNELDTTPATLKTLSEKGLVTIAPRQKRRDPLGAKRIMPSKPLPLNDEQRAALDQVTGNGSGSATDVKDFENTPVDHDPKPRPLLLHGVTGSGKTEVYLQAIAKELEAGRGAIVMVPEISLTPQTVQRFASRFGKCVAVLHSALSDGERYDEWHRIRSGEARVVVGPRSAVFAPVRDLGIIIVDEEHEPSYKQEDNPRYHARDAAVLRGAIEGAKVVLGSATPSLESWVNVQKGKYAIAEMNHRAGAGTLPVVRLVDMSWNQIERERRGGGEGGGGAIFSQELLSAIQLRLDRGEQTILFLNRRGFSRQLTCEGCGWVATCEKCGVPFTYHRADDCCRCHICGSWINTPKACPECRSTALRYQGVGTQRAEEALKKCFPRAAILRMDADSVARKNSHDDILGAFRRGEASVLLGTQMIAKGLDFPNVTLVGVLNADASLNMPDFRAGERTFQLLSQVAGRAGRAELPGEVIIQTYDPHQPVLRLVAGLEAEIGSVSRGGDAASSLGFAAFAERELKDRAEGFFPPYSHLAVIHFRSQDLRLVSSWAEMYAASLKKLEREVERKGGGGERKGRFEVGDALPSALEKADGWYRWEVVLRATSVRDVVRAWKWIRNARPAPKELLVGIDVDAYNLG